MHLSINTAYHLSEEKRIRVAWLPAIHIFIVALTVISMFHFPFMSGGHRVDLRLIPIILVGFFHGWKYVLPVVAMASIYRLGLGGPTAIQGVLFGLLFPAAFSILANLLSRKKHVLGYYIGVVALSWASSDLLSAKIRLFLPMPIAVLHLGALLLAFAVMYFFVQMGRRHLDSTKTLQFFAERDPLTGLYNMRKFEEKLKSHSHDGKQMFIAMIDIDRFKEINDKFGHKIGDAAIAKIGNNLMSHCGRDLIVARYGGDEFILYMAAERILTVKQKLEEIRKGAKEANVSIPGNPPFGLSLSIGMAELTSIPKLNEAIEEADKQLYLAKKLGRDRVC
ncbi:GGDEF domain-containing protein [Bacillus sp. FJAT-27245]|uniref:GGDEF domain-containing protein n=1 Tax=Bacillus sp. FJAT-27245 TaxID=1684144 RepID=UPI0006A78386|nr:GGDEF domain-containing protein [Bacillus sp. FJAT-27245]